MTRLLLCACLVALPLRHIKITSGYGFRLHPVSGQYGFHDGIDLRADHDTVFSVTDGLVLEVNMDAVSGIFIKTRTGDLLVSYCHLSQIFVLPGDSVISGQPVAVTGSSGRVTGSHLHLTMHYRGISINPLQFLLTASKQINQNRKENKQ